jgi:lysophospholipase L1-like esterase
MKNFLSRKQTKAAITKTILSLLSFFMLVQPAYAVSSQREDIEKTPFYDKNAELICGPGGAASSGSSTNGATPGQIYVLGDSISVGMSASGLEGQLQTAGYTPAKINAVTARSISGGGFANQSGAQAIVADADFIRASKTVVIELGTNPESDFTGKLNTLVADIKALNGTATIFLVDVAVSASEAQRLGAANTNKIIYAKATELGTPVISRFKIYYPNGDPQTYANLGTPATNFTDGIHATGEDYKKLSTAIVTALSQGTLATPNATNPCQCPVAGGAPTAATASLTGSDNHQKAFNYFISKGFTPQQSAGIVGNLDAESGVNPRIIQGGGESDNITVNNRTGYGIAQWTSSGRQQGLVDFARSRGLLIEGDLALQLDYLMKELTEGYTDVFTAIKAAPDLKTASDIFMTKFERPKDQSPSARDGRAARGQKVLELYGNGATSGSVTTSGSSCATGGVPASGAGGTIVEVAQRELAAGANEADGSYFKYTDGVEIPWCAAFASWVLKEAGKPFTGGMKGGWYITSNEGVESWAKANNKWIPAGQPPQPGDIMNLQGGGYPQGHVTIVISVEGNKINTIGGNESNRVKANSHDINASYIRGYARP